MTYSRSLLKNFLASITVKICVFNCYSIGTLLYTSFPDELHSG